MNLNRYAVFLQVCDSGSFTLAAEVLGMTKSVVSEHVSKLESDLGVQLLQRSTRRLVITDSGQAIRQATQHAMSLIEQSTRQIKAEHSQLAGKIRLTLPLDYARYRVAEKIAAFCELYPQIEIETIISDARLDLIGERLDFAIRLGELDDSSLIAARIDSFQEVLVGAPQYFKTHPMPTHPNQLAKYEWIILTVLNNPKLWHFYQAQNRVDVRVKGKLKTNATLLAKTWVKQGLGLTVLPNFDVEEDIRAGELIHVLPEWQLTQGTVYAVYPATVDLPVRVRKLIAFLKHE